MVSRTALHEYAPQILAFANLRGFRGVSMIVGEGGQRYVAAAVLRTIKRVGYGDYLWGVSANQLNNMSFWNQHATTLLSDPVKQESVFILPFSHKARTIIREIKRGQ